MPHIDQSQPNRADNARFVALFVEHERSLLAFIRSLATNWDDARDIFQEASVVLWEKFGEFEPGTNFQAWAFQIAHFKVIEHRRKQARNIPSLSPETMALLADEAAQTIDDSKARQSALAECVEQLAPERQSLLQLYHDPKLRLVDVAERVGKSVVTVRKHIRAVHERLMRCVAGKMGWNRA